MNDHYPAAQEPVIVVSAGPARLHRGPPARRLWDSRHPAGTLAPAASAAPRGAPGRRGRPILDRIGVSEGFLARSRPGSGLRLLDAGHRVMAEFGRDQQPGVHGFPQANMFHQPDLEELLLARVEAHPLIDLRRGAEVIGLDDDDAPARSPRPRSGCTPASPASCTRSPAGSCWAATAPTARSGNWPGSPWTTSASPSAGSWSTSRPRPALTPGTAWSRSATRPGPPPSCRSPATGTAGSSGCSTARTKAGLITPHALGQLLAALDRARRPGWPADHPQR